VTSKYDINVHTYLDNVDDEIAIIRTSLVKLCDNNFCAAIILDDMYYRSYKRYEYITSGNQRPSEYYPTSITKLTDMTSGLFDEHAIIEALKLIASKGYAKIIIEQNSHVLYEFYNSILEEALERLEGKTELPKLIYRDKSPEPQLQVAPVQSQPQRTRRSEAKAVKFHNKRAEIVALPATLTFDQWQQTLKDFDNKCAYCLTGDYEVLEHFIPLIFGGGTTACNCVPTCSSCNGIKSDQHPTMISPLSRIAEALQRVQKYLEARRGVAR